MGEVGGQTFGAKPVPVDHESRAVLAIFGGRDDCRWDDTRAAAVAHDWSTTQLERRVGPGPTGAYLKIRASAGPLAVSVGNKSRFAVNQGPDVLPMFIMSLQTKSTVRSWFHDGLVLVGATAKRRQ